MTDDIAATIPAITIWQPWASFIAHGWKSIETRRHPRFAPLVGRRIAIHAGRRWDDIAFARASRWLLEIDWLLEAGFERRARAAAGCVVATAFVREHRLLVSMADCAPALCWAPGSWGLVLEDVRALATPVPATGRQGIWQWTPPPGVRP